MSACRPTTRAPSWPSSVPATPSSCSTTASPPPARLLAEALRRAVGYIGALGSRRTQQRRAEHLRGLGVDATALARLRGPAGLDVGPIGAREIALSILAEIAAVRSGRDGRPLKDGTLPIMR